MTKELREQMDALRAIAPKLNASSEDAAKAIKQVNKFLADLRIGIAAEAPPFKQERYCEAVPDNTHEPRRRRDSILAYGRGPHGGEFCIHVIRRTLAMEVDAYTGNSDYEAFDEDLETWESCSRHDRLKSFAVLPDLLAEIHRNAERTVQDAAKAMAAIRESIANLDLGDQPTEKATPQDPADVTKLPPTFRHPVSALDQPGPTSAIARAEVSKARRPPTKP